MFRHTAISAILTLTLTSMTTAITHAAAAATAEPIAGVREVVSPEVRREVLGTVDEWKRAVIKKDAATLTRVLDDDLSYGHTTGEVLGKAQTIERALDPKQTFTSIDLSDVAVRAYGNFALVTHKISFRYVKEGTPGVANLSGIDVWVKKGHGWRLLARQLTRLPQ